MTNILSINIKKIVKNTESPEASEKFGEKTEHGMNLKRI
jgi:hypothetical protein